MKKFHYTQDKMYGFSKLFIILFSIILCVGVKNVISEELNGSRKTEFLTPDQKAERIATTTVMAGRLDEAEEKLLGIVKVSPTSAAAYLWLGRLNAKKGNRKAEVEFLRKSISNNPGNMTARLELAMALESTNEISAAAEIYEFIIRVEPKNVVARSNLAEIRLKQGNLDSAMIEYAAVVRIAPSYPKSEKIIGLLNRLYIQRAEELSSQLSSKKGRIEAIEIIKKWIPQKRIIPARRLLFDFVIQYPKNPFANYYMAVIYQRQNDMQAALKHYSIAVSAASKNIEFLYAYANALIRVDKLEKSLSVFKKIIQIADDGIIKTESKKQAGLLEGNILTKSGDQSAIIAHYKKLLDDDKTSLSLLSRLSKAQTTFGMHEEANKTNQLAAQLRNTAENEKRLIFEARTLISRKNYNGAEFRLQRILKNNPSHSQALYWLSVVYERQEKYDVAVKFSQQSVKLAPGNVTLEKELARLLALAGRSKEAIKIYSALANKVRDVGKRNELLRLSLFVEGQNFTQNNNFRQAKKHYGAMSRQFPKDIVILDALASVNIQLGLLDDAEEVYLKALKIDDRRALTYLRLAGLYTQMGKANKRREYYKKTLIVDPVGVLGKKALKNMLGNAQFALENGKLEIAFSEYNAVMDVFPNQNTAVSNAARVAENIQRFKASEVLYRRLVHNNPANFKYRVAFARMYIRADDLDSAIREFEKLYAIAPETVAGREANANLDILYSTKADQIIGDMKTEADQKNAVDTARIWIQEKNRIAPAKRILLAVLKLDEGSEKAHYWLGTIYDRYHIFDLSILHIATSVSLAPYNLQLNTAFGRVLARAGNLDAAEALYQKVLNEAEGTPLAIVTKKSLGFIVAQRLIQEGKLNEALTHYENMYVDFPGDAGLLARIASVYLSNNNFSAAEKVFQEVIRLQPNSPSVYLQIAALNKKQGNELAQKEALRKVIALDPNGLLGRQALNAFGLADGMLKLKEKKWREAIVIFNHVLTIEPDNNYATLALASAYLGLSEFAKAEAIYTKILTTDPGNSEARLNLARVYISTKRTASAVLELERVVAVSRETNEGRAAQVNLTNIYRERGTALLKKGKGDLAVREFRNAIARDKDDWQAHYTLGQLFQEGARTANVINRGKFLELAIHHFRETARIRPNSYDAHVKLAAIYDSMQDSEHALDSFVKALSLFTQDNEPITNKLINAIRIQVIRKEFAAQNFSWVLDELKDMLLLEPEAVYLHLFNGTVHIRQGDKESAIVSIKKAVKLTPKNVTARYRLGQLYEQTSSLDRAADQYRAIVFTSKSGAIVDAARERLGIVEEKLRIITFRIRYTNAVGGSEFNGGPLDRSFSSTLQLDVIAHFRPQKNIDLSFNASPSYSSFHDTENDSIATTYGFTGNVNFTNGFAAATLNRRETEGLLLGEERGKEKNISLAVSNRLKIPLLLSKSGVVSPSTLRFQMSAREFEPSELGFTYSHVRTLNITSAFTYPFKRGGSTSASYGYAETFNLDNLGTDYANTAHTVTVRISRPVANKLFAFASGALKYERYKNIDTILYAQFHDTGKLLAAKRRKTGQATLSLGLNYRLHRKLSLLFDLSYIDHRTDINERFMFNRIGQINGIKTSSLSDYTTYRSSLGFQFQF